MSQNTLTAIVGEPEVLEDEEQKPAVEDDVEDHVRVARVLHRPSLRLRRGG